MTRNALFALAIALVAVSVMLSIAFKGVFLVLLIPAFFAWNSGRRKSGR